VAPDTPPLKKNPVFLFTQDGFQKPYPFQPDIAVDITSAADQKIYAMAAHESQFFEWLPWTNGTLEQVPETEKERLEWLANWRNTEINPAVKNALAKWYGAEKARKVKYAEAFEICEFGRKPSDEEIKTLFPMIKN
jgi:hypothetical protein